MFHTSALVLLLLPFAVPSTPSATKIAPKADIFVGQTIDDLSGYYVCEGQEGPDKRYKGIAIITKKGDTYLVQWVIGSGLNFSGLAIRAENNLCAGWAMPVGDKGTIVRGINVYRIESGPRLSGRWAVAPGDGTLRSETLTFLKRIDD